MPNKMVEKEINPNANHANQSRAPVVGDSNINNTSTYNSMFHIILFLAILSRIAAFRIVQYNTEWLFYNYYAPANCPGTGCTWPNQSAALTHIQTVSSVLDKIQPDLVNICEVEGLDELNMLQYPNSTAYLLPGTDTATGQNVGLIAKNDITIAPLQRTSATKQYPIPGSTCGYTGNPGTTGVSKHYYTIVSVNNGTKIGLIGVHLLAYPTDPTRCAEREAQATIIQELVANFTASGMPVIVMGDFNDYDGETLDALSDKPLSSVLDIVKGLAGPYKERYTLTNAASLMQQSDRWSDWWDKNGDCVGTLNEMTMIDHVLVSPELLDKITMVEIWHEYAEYCGKWNSDHYPVIVDFDL